MAPIGRLARTLTPHIVAEHLSHLVPEMRLRRLVRDGGVSSSNVEVDGAGRRPHPLILIVGWTRLAPGILESGRVFLDYYGLGHRFDSYRYLTHYFKSLLILF